MKKFKNFKLLIGCGFITLFLLIFLITFNINFNKKKNYFVVKSRVENVENTKSIDNLDENTKIIGWIRIQGTNIDYPVVYNSNMTYSVKAEKYAKMSFYKPGFHNHFEISGHNIFNLSSQPLMNSKSFNKFEELMSFVYYQFAKENKYIQLTYEKEEYIYKIFAVGIIPISKAFKYVEYNDLSDEKNLSYLEMLDEYNLYKYDVDVTKDDMMLAVSTCTRFYGNNNDWRLYVVGRLLRPGEKTDNYDVELSDNYERISKILKGDEIDDEI